MAITKKPDACLGCPLYEAPGPAPAQGDPARASFIYILDQPSPQDCQHGSLLSDTTGRIFNRQLYDAGIRRSNIFITSLIKCHAGSTPMDGAIAHCSRFLSKELSRTLSKTCVLAGQQAFNHFIGTYSTYNLSLGAEAYSPTSSINSRMGCVEQRDGRYWIGVPHPSDYMRQPDIKDEIVMHLQKASTLHKDPPPLPRVHTNSSHALLSEQAQRIKHEGAFADDVETVQLLHMSEDDYVGGNYQVDLVGYSLGPWEATVISPSDIGAFAHIYSDPSITNYQHNGMYDQFHVARLLGHNALYDGPYINRRHQPWLDGMLAAHYHKSYKYKYLKPDCLSRYTCLPYYDREIEKVDRQFYNGLDVMATHQECVTLTKLLKQQGSWDCFYNIGMHILPLLEEQRIQGVKIDLRKAVLYKRIMEYKLQEAQSLMLDLCNGEDPSNPHVLKRLCYTDWELPKQLNKDTHKPTTDFDARQRLIAWIDKRPLKYKDQYALARRVLNLVDFFSGERKKLEYLSRISPDLRIHAYYKAHGAWSYRLSSTPNLQNFPKHDISEWGGAAKDTRNEQNPLDLQPLSEKLGSLRSLVIADEPTDLILSIDYAQMQLWIYAEQCKCKWLLDIKNSGEYIYGVVYETLFNEPFFKEGVPRTKANKRKDILEQFLRSAKTVPLGFLFGRTGNAVAEQYGWSTTQGNSYRAWFFKQCPEILTFHSHITETMKRQGYQRMPYGNWVWHPSYKVTDALNAPAQSPEALMLQESMLLIDQQLKLKQHLPEWQRTRIMLSVHDSLSFNVTNATTNPSHLIEFYETIVQPILNRQNKYFNGAIFPHEAEVSYAWDWDTLSYDQWKEQQLGNTISTRLHEPSQDGYTYVGGAPA